MRLRAIVTGTPRSGTKYIANLLCRLGVNSSHELYFNPFYQSIAELKHDVEVSWMAAPFLHELPPDVLIVHLVRDPLKTINSLAATGHMKAGNIYADFLFKHSRTSHPVHSWYRWNMLIEQCAKSRPYVRIRLEDWAQLREPYGLDPNSWGAVDAKYVSEDLWREAREMANRYGYDVLTSSRPEPSA